MNLGIVVLDTLRYDVSRDEMDAVQGMADFSFQKMYSTSRWTVPAHGSLFTGLYPTEAGTTSDNFYLTTDAPTLAEELKAAGFETVGFSNNVYIDSFFNFDRGFDDLHRGPALEGSPTSPGDFDWNGLFNRLDEGPSKYARAVYEVLRSDAPTLPTLVNGLRMLRKPGYTETNNLSWIVDGFEEHVAGEEREDLFFFANLMTCHSPYAPPAEYRSLEPYDMDPLELTLSDEPVPDEIHERQWECYKGGARYLDDVLPAIMTGVDWDALFIMSDHGELFGEHGLRQHQYGMYEELVHVPAVAIGEEVPSGETEELTSIVDVHRTLLDLAGVEPREGSRGENLFSDDFRRDHVYAESTGNYRWSEDARGLSAKIPKSWGDPHYMLQTRKARLTVDREGTKVEGLSGDVSPREKEELLKEGEELRSSMHVAGGEEIGTEVPASIEAKLKALGYK